MRREQKPPNLAAEAAERLAAILDAAERATSSVIDDAAEQARRHREEARSVADRLRGMAERLQALADELDSPEPGGRGKPPPPRLAPVEAAPQAAVGTAPRRSQSAGARLLATQMAVSGSSREEIEARLRSDFDIEETSEILDAILGPEE